MSSPVFIVGDMNSDFWKQNSSSSNCFNSMQFNGLTEMLATATQIVLGSATLIVHTFHNFFFVKLEYGILGSG